MKEMINTEKLLRDKIADASVTSYALLIGYGDDEWCFTTDNVDLDTYFDAASIGKVFPTTTLILKAIDEGRISLDDKIDRFFPNVPEDKKNITVKHLLTHTSGMLRKPFPDNVAERGRESIVEFILSVPLSHPIGSKYAYCCTGIILLGFIVEWAFGMTLDVAFERLLCKPLGLTRSRYNLPPDEPNAINCNHDLRVCDIRRDDYNVQRMNGIPAGPGGNYCTAGDLRKFVKAVMRRDERLYSREIFDISEKNYTEGLDVEDVARGIENHALGYTYVNKNCPQACDLFPDGSLGHDGWTGQCFYFNRDMGLYVIFLTDANRCTVKKYGESHYDEVRALRAEMHRAIKKDLGI